MGRKNYLFAGSHAAARRAADLYRLTRTCAQYGVPPLTYFTDVLQKLATGWSITRLEELLPSVATPGAFHTPSLGNAAVGVRAPRLSFLRGGWADRCTHR